MLFYRAFSGLLCLLYACVTVSAFMCAYPRLIDATRDDLVSDLMDKCYSSVDLVKVCSWIVVVVAGLRWLIGYRRMLRGSMRSILLFVRYWSLTRMRCTRQRCWMGRGKMALVGGKCRTHLI